MGNFRKFYLPKKLLGSGQIRRIKELRKEIINVKKVEVYLDASAKKDLTKAGIAPKEILEKIIYIYQKENSLDFKYDFSSLIVKPWRHKKPPRQFWSQTFKCSLHDFLFMEAEKKIRCGDKEVVFVFSGDLWVSSGLTYRGWNGDGIILIGTKDRIINPFDALMNRTSFRYVIKKMVNIIKFLILFPNFLRESKRNRYLLALAATGVHEQAHAFGIRHTNGYSVMNDANIWYYRFNKPSRIRLKSIFSGKEYNLF